MHGESVHLLSDLLFLKSLWLVTLLILVTVTATVVLFRLQRGVLFDTFFFLSCLLGFWLFFRLVQLVHPTLIAYPLRPWIDTLWTLPLFYHSFQGWRLISRRHVRQRLLFPLFWWFFPCSWFLVSLWTLPLPESASPLTDPLLAAVTLMILVLVPLLLKKTSLYREKNLDNIIQAFPLAAVVTDTSGCPIHYNTYYEAHFQAVSRLNPKQLKSLSLQPESTFTAEGLWEKTGLTPLDPTAAYSLRVQPAGPGFVLALENITLPRLQIQQLHEKTRNLEQVNQLLKVSLAGTADQAAQQERRFFLREMNQLLRHELTDLHEAVAASLNTKSAGAFHRQVIQVRLQAIHCHQLLRLYLYRVRSSLFPLRHLAALMQALCQAYLPLGLAIDLIPTGSRSMPLRQAECLYRCLFACLQALVLELHPSSQDDTAPIPIMLQLTATPQHLTLLLMDTAPRSHAAESNLLLPDLFWLMDGTLTRSGGSDVQRTTLSLPLKAGDDS
ncbi:hypothetical protein [Anoxynatronum sibiricum]|uniref:Uncharacterized protein n=1 Tax=Anoxynatronum sibiricum TaxID=210623 RepID=A0ABU9VVG1_9CLOT